MFFTEFEYLLYQLIVGYPYYLRDYQTKSFICMIHEEKNANTVPIMKNFGNSRVYAYFPDTQKIAFSYEYRGKSYYAKIDLEGKTESISFSSHDAKIYKDKDFFFCAAAINPSESIDSLVKEILDSSKKEGKEEGEKGEDENEKNATLWICFKNELGEWKTWVEKDEEKIWNESTVANVINPLDAEIEIMAIFGI